MAGGQRAITPHHKQGERQMTCPEYERLLKLYETALRQWGHLMWSAKWEFPAVPERLASEMKQRAYAERNEAHERMRAHQRSCKACRSEPGAC
jgi:hypothetical protein